MSSIRTPHPKTLAAVKSGVIVSLIETLLEIDAPLRASLPEGRYGATLSAPGGVRQTLRINGGRAGATLRFPQWRDMIRVLSGEKGAVIPVPTGPGFFKALKTFKTCAGAVSGVMAALPEEGDADALAKKTRLLLTAALRGVCEVYTHDHWILMKSRKIPAGTIGIRVKGQSAMGGILRVDRDRMSLERNDPTGSVNALLEFRDIPTCSQVLTGTVPALGALGDGRVMIQGKIPMIQGLFPLLDRFGEMMQ